MNPHGHLERAEEFEREVRSYANPENHIAMVCEGTFLAAHHFLAYGCARRFNIHSDIHRHERILRENQSPFEVLEAWRNIDTAHHGHVYGGQGNGETAEEVINNLEVIKAWALGVSD